MNVQIGTAVEVPCAGCGSMINRSRDNVIAVVGDKQYHISCTPEAREKAHWLYHSIECPTCQGKGRIKGTNSPAFEESGSSLPTR